HNLLPVSHLRVPPPGFRRSLRGSGLGRLALLPPEGKHTFPAACDTLVQQLQLYPPVPAGQLVQAVQQALDGLSAADGLALHPVLAILPQHPVALLVPVHVVREQRLSVLRQIIPAAPPPPLVGFGGFFFFWSL